MKYDFELIPVPTDALEAVGIIPGVMAEAFVDGKRIVIQKAEDDAFCKSYNEDCEDCPYIIIWIPFMLIMAQPFNYW